MLNIYMMNDMDGSGSCATCNNSPCTCGGDAVSEATEACVTCGNTPCTCGGDAAPEATE